VKKTRTDKKTINKGGQVNKLYQKVKQEYDQKVAQGEKNPYVWVRAAELATLIMEGVKKKWPQYKFAKSSKVYSGGSSVNIYLQDGWKKGVTKEQTDEMKKFVDTYSGAGFDGMVDYKYYEDIWLMADGSVALADNSGGGAVTGGVVEGYDYPKPVEQAIKISSGSWVFFEARPKYGTKDYQGYWDWEHEQRKQKEQKGAA
jgi:hypothetical protein